MERMLINAAQQEDLRVALVDGTVLYDLDIERPGREQKKSNIYKGRLTRREEGLNAAFVEYGSSRQGFLPFKEVARTYYDALATESQKSPQIKDVLKKGQELLVQVDKEERGTKGAALTTFISLAGAYLVLMPNNPRAGGISRRIEGAERDALRDLLSQLKLPEGMGLIVRTAGVGKNLEELQWDLEVLLKQWSAIEAAGKDHEAPCLIYQESDVVIRAIRDYLHKNIEEVIVDDKDVYEKVKQQVERTRPDFVDRVKLYEESIPIFNHYKIESQIEIAFQRKVTLPAGGAIVIDRTEALVAIDINSARATAAGDIEETALNTNLEAADEIARQLRLRDLGGLIVIDFIDMTPLRNQRQVEQRLRDALRIDRARIQVGKLSRFGLLEMSRQRLRPAIAESIHVVCPRCNGQGTIRGAESSASSLIRLIEEEALKENVTEIQVQVPVDVATFMLNEKRGTIIQIEERQNVSILVIPNKHLETPNYKIKALRTQDARRRGRSYTQIEEAPEEQLPTAKAPKREAQQRAEPAVSHVTLPNRPASKKPGLIKKIVGKLLGSTPEEPKEPQKRPYNTQQRNSQNYNNRRPRNTRGGSSRNRQGQRGGNTRSSGTGSRTSANTTSGNSRSNTRNTTGNRSRRSQSQRTRTPSGQRSGNTQSGNTQSKDTSTDS